jgi:hypothetical protein
MGKENSRLEGAENQSVIRNQFGTEIVPLWRTKYWGKWPAAAQGHLEFVESLTLTHNSCHQGDLAP